MKKLLYIIAIAGFTGFNACKPPTENVTLNVTPDVIKYMVDVKVLDANATATLPPNATLSIGGEDAEYVYDITGKKNFTLHDGKMTLGIDPARMPSETDPISITLRLTAPGYLPQEVDVEIMPSQFSKSVNVSMLNLSNPPAGLELDVKYYKLQNGQIAQNTFVKGKTTEDSTYFDDGLTTVVMPKGTSFYHWKYTQTGTYRGVKYPLKTQQDTSYINDKMVIGTISTPYQDTIEYPIMGYVKQPVTGSDSLVVVCYYATGYDVDIKFTGPYTESTNGNMISLLNGSKVRTDELLYESAVQKRLAYVQFVAYVMENGKRIPINVFPEHKSPWFTSYKLKENFTNPITNQTIKEGDSLEVGVNPVTGRTMRTVVKKAANGELRAEAQATEVGFYYQAEHTYEYDYTFNMSAPGTSVIPDPENLSAYGIINLGKYDVHLPLYYYNGSSYSESRKIASKEPIIQNDAKVRVFYADKYLGERQVQQGQVMVYDPSYFSNLPTAIDVTCKLYCENKKTYIYPSAFVTIYVDGRTFNCRFVDGRWSTRALQVGQVVDAYGWVGGYYLEYKDQEITHPMLLQKDIKGNESVCF